MLIVPTQQEEVTMHHNFSLHIGKINAVGDPNNKDESNRYRVLIPEDNIVTGWLFQIKRSSIKNQDDFVYDLNQPVVIVLFENHREGFILGAFNNKNTPPKTTDKDTEQTTFSDGTIIKYDRNAHTYEIDTTQAGGKVIINGGNNGGMLIEQKAEENFNNLKSYIDEKFAAVVAGFGAIGVDGGSGLAAYNAVVIPPFVLENMEDQNAKH